MNILFTNDNDSNWSKLGLEPRPLEGFSEADIIPARLVVIHSDDELFALRAIRKIRQSAVPAVYLKYVVFVSHDSNVTKRLEGAADMTLNINAFTDGVKNVTTKADNLNDMINQLPGFDQQKDVNIALKILRYMHVRHQGIYPQRGIYSKIGYHYPQVDLFFNKEDGSLNKLLDFLEEQNLLTAKFYDKAYTCGNCQCGFLNFREICPQCKSAHLDIQDIIHHFYCAYAGPISDFEQNQRMVCPKCKKELKHIGVDYDRPSIIYICQACDFSTQDPDIDTVCFNCGRNTIPENLIHKEIKEYSLTALAENAAVFGIDNLFQNILSDTLKLTDYEIFKDYLFIEIARIFRYHNFTSAVCLLCVENLHDVYLELGLRSREFFNELAGIIKKVLRTSDIITSYNDSIFLFLLTETPVEGAEIAMNRLNQNIKELLQHNLQKTATIQTQVLNIDGNRTVEELIEEVIERGIH